MSGFYTTDFPNYPPSFFDFIADDVPDDKTLTIQGTKVKVLNYNEEVEIVLQGTNVFDGSEDHQYTYMGTPFMWLVLLMGYLIMRLTQKGTIWLIRLR